MEAINERQKKVLFGKFFRLLRRRCQWKEGSHMGLSYKPGTDDMREAPSLTLISQLLDAGCTVKAYDPAAMEEARHRLGGSIEYAADIYDAVRDADVFFHVTEWKEYRMPDWQK
jgi:UDPglucose 6-dehydrogenase